MYNAYDNILITSRKLFLTGSVQKGFFDCKSASAVINILIFLIIDIVFLWITVFVIHFIFCLREGIIINKDHIINDQIRVKEVRLIGENGDQLGVVPTNSAKEMAYGAGLDLVLIAAGGNPPVAKIMDYGRFKYEQIKKVKEQKKAQKEKIVELKEIWLSATIDTNDMKTKANNANKFLKAGDKVRASIKLKGRQMARPEIAVKVMEEFFELVKENGVMEKQPNLEGRSISMIIASNVKK